ncbi:hypothetical protein MP638_002717 [Amoeboaphelidium occidentale]|nr:hypothetical protein MP638_002717 [Amoeboaphelidium occidentale]
MTLKLKQHFALPTTCKVLLGNDTNTLSTQLIDSSVDGKLESFIAIANSHSCFIVQVIPGKTSTAICDSKLVARISGTHDENDVISALVGFCTEGGHFVLLIGYSSGLLRCYNKKGKLLGSSVQSYSDSNDGTVPLRSIFPSEITFIKKVNLIPLDKSQSKNGSYILISSAKGHVALLPAANFEDLPFQDEFDDHSHVATLEDFVRNSFRVKLPLSHVKKVEDIDAVPCPKPNSTLLNLGQFSGAAFTNFVTEVPKEELFYLIVLGRCVEVYTAKVPLIEDSSSSSFVNSLASAFNPYAFKSGITSLTSTITRNLRPLNSISSSPTSPTGFESNFDYPLITNGHGKLFHRFMDDERIFTNIACGADRAVYGDNLGRLWISVVSNSSEDVESQFVFKGLIKGLRDTKFAFIHTVDKQEHLLVYAKRRSLLLLYDKYSCSKLASLSLNTIQAETSQDASFELISSNNSDLLFLRTPNNVFYTIELY